MTGTTVGKKKKWSSPHSQQSSPKWSNWVQSQKWQNDLCLFPRQTTQPHSNPSLCPSHWCQRSWSWQVLWRPKRPSDGGSLSGSSVHGILQGRILEWVAISFFRERLSRTNSKKKKKKKKKVLFIIGDWNAKAGNQEIFWVTGKFGTVLQYNGGQRPTEFFKRMHWS